MVSEATAAAGLGEDRLEVVEEGDLAMVDGRLLIKTITTVTPVAMELGVQRGRRTIGAEIGIIHQTTIRSTAMTREPVPGGLRRRMRGLLKEEWPGERKKPTTVSRKTASTRAVAGGLTRNQQRRM